MIVRDLIEKLKKMPADAHVVVAGEVVHGVEIRTGEVEIGYYNPVFRSSPKGKAQAVVFLANTELSTGEVVSSPK